MTSVGLELFVVLLLILVNGLFAMSELAVVSARKTRLQQRAQEGDRKASLALELANSPNQFLAPFRLASPWSASWPVPLAVQPWQKRWPTCSHAYPSSHATVRRSVWPSSCWLSPICHWSSASWSQSGWPWAIPKGSLRPSPLPCSPSHAWHRP